MLTAQRRHQPPCNRPMFDKGFTKCSCPLVIRGTLNGKHISLSTAKYLPPTEARNLKAARDLALLWEREGQPVKGVLTAPQILNSETEPSDLPTIAKAVDAYMKKARASNIGEAQMGKKKLWIERRLVQFAADQGRRFVSEIDLAFLRDWRDTWQVGPSTRQNTQEMVIGFLWECERNGWLPRHAPENLTEGLGKINVQKTKIEFFSAEEYQKLLDATYLYSDRPSIDKHNSFDRQGGDRIRAFMELMRWTGLRIRDAAVLEKSRLRRDGDSWSILIYQKKTGDDVYCPIPPAVAEMLLNVPASQKGNTNATYFFWTGMGKPKTLASNWERSFARLFSLAGLKKPDGSPKRCYPHMFRHTFAIHHLLSGTMLLEDVSELLGHSSVKITEKHYKNWCVAQQSSLNRKVLESWIQQGKVEQPGAAPKVAVMPKRA